MLMRANYGSRGALPSAGVPYFAEGDAVLPALPPSYRELSGRPQTARHAVDRTTAGPQGRVAHRAPRALVPRRPPAGRAGDRRRLRGAASAGLRADRLGLGRDRGADRRPGTGDAARPRA